MKNIPLKSITDKNVLSVSLNNVPMRDEALSSSRHSLSDYDNSQCEPVGAIDIACQAVRVFETHVLHQIKQKKQKKQQVSNKNERDEENENESEGENGNYYHEKYNSQSVSIESAIVQAIKNNGKSTIQYPTSPLIVYGENSTNSDDINTANVQKWLNNLLPECSKLEKYKLLDYSYACPYNKENGVVVYINQLYNMPIPKRKGLFRSFSAPLNNTLFKVIYSIYPGGSYYKNSMENISTSSRLPWGIKFTEKTEILSTPQSPVFNDGPKLFYPKSMNLLYNQNEVVENDVFVILDVRTIIVPVHTSSFPSSSVTQSSDQNKSYWAILPLSKESRAPEKGKIQSHRFLNTGTFQLPLFEGSFPYKYISEIDSDITVLSNATNDAVSIVNERVNENMSGNTGGRMSESIDGNNDGNKKGNKHENKNGNKNRSSDVNIAKDDNKEKDRNNDSHGGGNVAGSDRREGGILGQILSKLSTRSNPAGEFIHY